MLCVDCADPYALLRFWAAALEWDIEDNTALIKDLAAKGVVTENDYIEVGGRLGWPTMAAIRDPAGADFGRVLFQHVPEPKTVKNRVHLDIHLGPERRDRKVTELVQLGGVVLGTFDEFGARWTVVADPEGNELCIAV